LLVYIESSLDGVPVLPASDKTTQLVDTMPVMVNTPDTMSRVSVVGMTGEELVRRRKEAGLTQAQVAQIIGVSHRTITRWEHGGAKIDVWKASEVRRVLFPDCSRDKVYMRGLVDKSSRVDADVSTGRDDMEPPSSGRITG
jgi:DNA-binding XRE family transcriptional regulator